MSIGLDLSRRFFNEVVAPLIAEAMPDLRYGAARVGNGSEVLGFDTAMSADHNYGPIVQIFLRDADFDERAKELMAVLDAHLSDSIDGWPIRFPSFGRWSGEGTLASDHGVELFTLERWCDTLLGIAPDRELTTADWLALPEQKLLVITAGAVFRDDDGRLAALRNRLAYFPRDLWLHKLAAQWSRIGEERAFVGRTGDNGDDLGSRIIAARLCQDVMRLCFLIERRYAPYAKWFGTAFARLDCASTMVPLLNAVLVANDWRSRGKALAEACKTVAELQRTKGVPGAIEPRIHDYFTRPFPVLNADEIAAGLRDAIGDAKIRELRDWGAVDQWTDSTPLLTDPRALQRAIAAINA
jgi:hypothetical protein